MSIREFKLTLEIGQQREIHSTFDNLRCTSSNGPYAISFGDDNNRITFERGLEMGFIDEQHKFTLHNNGNRKLELVIVTGKGTRLKDDRSLYSVADPVPIVADGLMTVKPNETFPVKFEGAQEVQPIEFKEAQPVLIKAEQKTGTCALKTVRSTAVEIVTANVNRRHLRLQNVGPVSVIVGGGIYLDPLEVFETDATNAFSANVIGAAHGRISVYEVV
jgi:hypothetical protein